MADKKDELRLDDALLTDVAPEGEDYSLEEILAEFGAGGALYGGEPEAPPRPETPGEPKPEEKPKQEPEKNPEQPDPAQAAELARQEARDKLLAQAVDLEKLEKELPRAPRPISLEEVVGSTVDAVMEARREPLLKPKRGLFSRRPLEDTETLYGPPEPEPEPDPEPIGPEEDLCNAAADWRERYQAARGGLVPALLIALVPTFLAAVEKYGFTVPMWSGDIRFQSIVVLTCLALNILLCRGVFKKGFLMAARKRCVSELLISLSALAAAADCAACLLAPERTAVPPYGGAACLALVFAQWGVSRECRGMYDMFRAASLDDEPPYLVTDTERGACKQRGSVPGFYTTAMKDDAATLWQTAFLPLVLVGTVVFAGLSSLGQGRGGDFLLNWSAILAAGGTFALPLCWALPWSRLSRHLQQTGCAVAGWAGAEKISRRRCMIVTDGDLFPPGTLRLNGERFYGEERKKAVSYAASMARSAGSGLERLFGSLLREECGRYETADDFSFFEEGGWSAAIHGESVLMGTASFMRKMNVRLPGDVNLKTGVFLAVDRQLIAVFAVKYEPAENVDYALRMMRRNRITPILAARDPNITPALLKRKFHKGVKVEYPDLTSRVALSEAEHDRDLPRALLFREGLLPYAETVTGSRKLCRSVHLAAVLGILGSAAGTLLAFYLVFLGAYELLTPLALVTFLLLWTVPVLLA